MHSSPLLRSYWCFPIWCARATVCHHCWCLVIGTQRRVACLVVVCWGDSADCHCWSCCHVTPAHGRGHLAGGGGRSGRSGRFSPPAGCESVSWVNRGRVSSVVEVAVVNAWCRPGFTKGEHAFSQPVKRHVHSCMHSLALLQRLCCMCWCLWMLYASWGPSWPGTTAFRCSRGGRIASQKPSPALSISPCPVLLFARVR